MADKRNKGLVSVRACRGCKYFSGQTSTPVCTYILWTGKPRPCPAGEGCTAKDTGKKRKYPLTLTKKAGG